MLNIATRFLKAAVCLSPSCVSGIVGFRLRRDWVSTANTCISTFSDEILGKGMMNMNNFVVLETISNYILGI